MRIALATPRVAKSLDEGLELVSRLQSEAAAQGAEIVCFPEAYLPGLRGQDFDVPAFARPDLERAIRAVSESAREHGIATIAGMERPTAAGPQIVAYVINADGSIQGYQTKNQLDPSEDPAYVPGDTRRMFEVKGTKFGIAICHEGWRYPETVSWG